MKGICLMLLALDKGLPICQTKSNPSVLAFNLVCGNPWFSCSDGHH